MKSVSSNFIKKEVFIVILLLVLAIFVIGQSFAEETNENIDDGNITEEENNSEDGDVEEIDKQVSIELDKIEYGSNEEFEGKIKIFLEKEVIDNPELEVVLQVGSEQEVKSLVEVLDNASKTYVLKTGILNGTNPEESKTLYFDEAGVKMIGIEVPTWADVRDFEMKVEGSDGNGVKFPKIDIGNNGELEWYYLGDFVEFEEEFIMPKYLDDSHPGNGVYLSDNETFLCQKIDIPFTKDLNIAVNYKKLGEIGDLKATILSPSSWGFEWVSGGADNCVLPEDGLTPDNEFGYKNCHLEISHSIQGENLVCIINMGNSVEEQNEYEIKSGPMGEESTSYYCNLGDDSHDCYKFSQANFYIKTNIGKYSEVLEKEVLFSEYALGLYSAVDAFRRYVGSDNPPEDREELMSYPGICKEEGFCLIPIIVNVSSSGEISFKDLDLNYFYENTLWPTRTFYNVEELPPKIEKVEETDLTEGYLLEIPISLFDLEVPELPSTLEKLTDWITISIGDFSDEKNFTVYSQGYAPGSFQDRFIKAKEIIEGFQTLEDEENKVFSLMGLNDKINEAQQEIVSIETTFINSGESTELESKLTDLEQGLPKEINFLGANSDILFIEPNDISNNIVSSDRQEEVYFDQEKVEVIARVSTFNIEYLSGISEEVKLVKKTIEAKENLNDINFFEKISSSVVSSVDDIIFEQTPTIVESNSLIKWYIASLNRGSQREYVYLLKTENNLIPDDLKTILVLPEPEEEEDEGPEYTCGDGVCDPGENKENCPKDCKTFPWWILIIIILLVMGAGAFYIFYGSKFFQSKKSPFESNEHLNSVVKYIKTSKESKKSEKEIRKKLEEKGWTKEQIDFAFEELEWENKGGKKGPEKSSNIQPLKDYINLAHKKGLSKKDIKKKLLSKGWDEETINKELK